jgi:tryptophan synthase alpha chain
MAMSFRRLKSELRKDSFHVSPFLMLGDPTPDLSLELAKTAVREGASMLEIGFPYGDPVADGPAIQAANVRALEAGTSTEKALELLARIREACPKTPLNLLIYGNLVHARGYDRFCGDAVQAGASSLLVPDISLEESTALRKASRRAKLGHVELVGPLTAEERLRRIDRATDAFLYLVAHQGVTGVRNGSFQAIADLVGRTTRRVEHPVCLGFGLSQPDHLRQAFSSGARIAVVGSLLAQVVAKAWQGGSPGRETTMMEDYVAAVRPLVAVQAEFTA